jgi:hypothetical protein
MPTGKLAGTETGWDGVEWIDLALDEEALVNRATSLLVPRHFREILEWFIGQKH